MIFVTMSQDDGGDVVFVFVEEGEVRDGNIDAVSGLLGEAHAGVENQHLIAITHSHAVHSKLADTAEWDDLEDTCHKLHSLTRMTYRCLDLYYPPYDQTNDRFCRTFPAPRDRQCDRDHASRLLPHRRCVVGSVQHRPHRD